jgi:hypothetical protein
VGGFLAKNLFGIKVPLEFIHFYVKIQKIGEKMFEATIGLR